MLFMEFQTHNYNYVALKSDEWSLVEQMNES